MKYILIIIFSSSGLDSYSVDTQEFENKDACTNAARVVQEEILNRHGAVQMTLKCVPKGTEIAEGVPE
jgi:hypothetical protein